MNTIEDEEFINKRKIENGDQLKAAAEQGKFDQVKFLIESVGVHPDQKDQFGDTALHGAVSQSRLLIIEYLLEKGSNSNLVNGVGSTALHKAVTISTLKEQMDVLRLLLKFGADPTIKNQSGLIPEQLASFSRAKELLQGDQAVTITVSVPKQHHGKVIGKGGMRLKELKELTNTQITIPEPNVSDQKITIKGRKDDVQNAKQRILEIINPPKVDSADKDNGVGSGEDNGGSEENGEPSVEIEILNLKTIPKDKHKLIIGAGGKTINRLREEFNVKITIPPSGSPDSDISIQGESESISKVTKEIYSIINRGQNTQKENTGLYQFSKSSNTNGNVVVVITPTINAHKFNWSLCSPNSKYELNVKSINVPTPTRGQMIKATVEGTVDKQVTGGNFHIKVAYGPVIVVNENRDVCGPFNPFKCPVPPGPYKNTFDLIILPSNAPSGKYNVIGGSPFNWSFCSGISKTSTQFAFKSFTVHPNPPKKGDLVQITVEGTLDESLIKGGTFNTQVKYKGIYTVMDDNIIFCQDTSFLCNQIQQHIGTINFHQSLNLTTIPSNAPDGIYNGRILVTDLKKEKIACINFELLL
eukprot:gene9877-12117_t